MGNEFHLLVADGCDRFADTVPDLLVPDQFRMLVRRFEQLYGGLCRLNHCVDEKRGKEFRNRNADLKQKEIERKEKFNKIRSSLGLSNSLWVPLNDRQSFWPGFRHLAPAVVDFVNYRTFPADRLRRP